MSLLWRGWALAAATAAALTACQGGPRSPSGLALDLVASHVMAGLDQPSGLSFHDGRLFVIGDESATIHVVTTDGEVVARVEPMLTADESAGIEAVLATDDTVWLALEPSAEIVEVRWRDGVVLRRWSVPEAHDGDSGLEGLLRDPSTGHIVVAKEEKPAMLLALGPDGEVVRRLPLGGMRDVSGLAAFCPGEVLAVSQEDRAVHRLTDTGQRLASWPLDADGAEGIAFDGSRQVFVVDEITSRLMVFDIGASCAPGPP